jgi:hypothetical protein
METKPADQLSATTMSVRLRVAILTAAIRPVRPVKHNTQRAVLKHFVPIVVQARPAKAPSKSLSNNR